MKRFNSPSWPNFTSLRRHGFVASAVAVSLTGWLLAQDPFPARDVPSPPTPITDPAVPNPVPEVLGTGPGDVLTRGPIHEAFAKPVVEGNAEPPVVPKAPPALIEEIPPDERPVGENVLWIPGYYAWDEDKIDFIWISGVYRDAPPGHTWVAGYWRSVPNGAQWVPGFWTTVAAVANQQAATEVEFLPEPPASLEQGPTTAQPGDSQFWIPGNWRYVENKYAWQAGYWTAGQAGWIWVPAHYNWTPLGFVYTPGYWDYSLAQRGLVFAPVYFDAAYYANPVVYRPAVVLRPNFLTVHLWSRPRFAHYYFGDYYGNSYATVGYRPWFTPLVPNRAYYDPLFSYYSWQGRRVDPRWNDHIHQRYEFVAQHADARPPRTYRDQYRLAQQPQNVQYVNNAMIVNSSNTIIDLGNNAKNGKRGPRQGFGTEEDVASLQIQNAAMTANLAQIATQQKEVPKAPLQLEKVSPETLDRFAKQGRQFREIAAQRQQLAGPGLPGITTETVAPSTSGNPVTKTVPVDTRSKVGGGKIRLPAVQPIVSVAETGVTPRGTAGNPATGSPLTPVVTTDATGKVIPNPRNRSNPTTGPATSKTGQPTTGTTAVDNNIPTDRNPNKLGKNVPPSTDPGIGSGGYIGGVAVPGGVDTVVAPLDIVTPGAGPVVNNQGQTGTTANNTGTTTPDAPSNSPNTTATTVPGQRTPANGAFGQDQGPLVPPGQLAPGQQNPEVFNPKVGNQDTSAFNPTIGNPNVSTNANGANATGNNTTNNGTTGTTPNTTATTVPGQRTPANGAFGQDQGPLVPPGQLAPGQQNPEVFNPKVADPTKAPGTPGAPAFNPKIGTPGTTTNPLGTNTTNGAATGNTTGLRALPPNDQSTQPRGGTLGDKTIPGTNQPYPALRSGTDPGPDNPTNRGDTLGNKTIPGTNQPYPVLRSGANPGPDNPTNRGGTLGNKTIPGTNQPYPVLKPSGDAPKTGNKSGIPLSSKGNPGNDNPVLGSGVSAGPKINPNQGVPNVGGGAMGNKNIPGTNQPFPKGNPAGPNRGVGPNRGGFGGGMPAVPGGGGGGLAPVGGGAAPAGGVGKGAGAK